MATELDAARLLVWRAAWMQDQRATHHRGIVDREVLRGARHHARLQRAVQIHGGYGYTREFDVERYLRDAEAGRDRRGDQRGPEDGHRARAACGPTAETATPPRRQPPDSGGGLGTDVADKVVRGRYVRGGGADCARG
jgi:hypothetical protein